MRRSRSAAAGWTRRTSPVPRPTSSQSISRTLNPSLRDCTMAFVGHRSPWSSVSGPPTAARACARSGSSCSRRCIRSSSASRAAIASAAIEIERVKRDDGVTDVGGVEVNPAIAAPQAALTAAVGAPRRTYARERSRRSPPRPRPRPVGPSTAVDRGGPRRPAMPLAVRLGGDGQQRRPQIVEADRGQPPPTRRAGCGARRRDPTT